MKKLHLIACIFAFMSLLLPVSAVSQSNTLSRSEINKIFIGHHMCSLQCISWEKFGTAEFYYEDKADEEDDEEEVEEVFMVVEGMPEFPGGQQELMKYFNENLHYPVIASKNGIQGRVICQFTVWKDGSIRDIKVVKSVDKSLDNEAIRLVKNMPKWKPGKQRGKAVPCKYTLPITFRL